MTDHLNLDAGGKWWIATTTTTVQATKGDVILNLDARQVRFTSVQANTELHDVDITLGEESRLRLTASGWSGPQWMGIGIASKIYRIDHLTELIQRLTPIAEEHGQTEQDVLIWLHRPTTYFRDEARPIDHLHEPAAIVYAANQAWGVVW